MNDLAGLPIAVVLLGGPLVGAGVALMGMVGPMLVVPLDRPGQAYFVFAAMSNA